MSSAAEYVFNPDVHVTNDRKMAIRGVTINHIDKHIDLGGGHGGGIIASVSYRGNETSITYLEDDTNRLRTVTCADPLVEITINDK